MISRSEIESIVRDTIKNKLRLEIENTIEKYIENYSGFADIKYSLVTSKLQIFLGNDLITEVEIDKKVY